jgi:hypothetical protein
MSRESAEGGEEGEEGEEGEGWGDWHTHAHGLLRFWLRGFDFMSGGVLREMRLGRLGGRHCRV